MTWTDAKPLQPGWYWYRTNAQDTEAIIARIAGGSGRLAVMWSRDESDYLDALADGQWAGPIEVPHDPL